MQAGLLLVRRPDHDRDYEHDDPEDDVDEDDHDRDNYHDDPEDDVDDVDHDVEPEWSACPGIIFSFLGDFPLLSNCLSSLLVRCHLRFVVYLDAT